MCDRLVYRTVKRMIDAAVALLLLTALAPLLGATALLIRLSMGRPVLFRQTRTGRRGAPFVISKFRTMTNELPHPEGPFRDAERVTRLGHWLRELSLDELPQLWNVVRGDMSLVGPRPLLEEYSPWLTERERLRFAVRPGITGWAQVNGRASVPWDDRLAMDVWYVDNSSLSVDLKILALTALRVVQRRDVHLGPDTGFTNDLDVERRLKRESPDA